MGLLCVSFYFFHQEQSGPASICTGVELTRLTTTAKGSNVKIRCLLRTLFFFCKTNDILKVLAKYSLRNANANGNTVTVARSPTAETLIYRFLSKRGDLVTTHSKTSRICKRGSHEGKKKVLPVMSRRGNYTA